MSEEEGRRALTELLADEVVVAVRIGQSPSLENMEPGLWIVNPTILKGLKDMAIESIEKELSTQHETIFRDHRNFDLCAGGKSFVIFPTQQQLNTLLHLHSDTICRTCESKEVICILTATEYFDESTEVPGNCIIRTLDEGIGTLLT
jgi:hypothetical protein